MKTILTSRSLGLSLSIGATLFSSAAWSSAPKTADQLKAEIGAAPRNADSLLPEGWKSVQEATGDLNEDQIDDRILIVLEADAGEFAAQQYLAVFKGDRDGRFTLHTVGGAHLYPSNPSFMEANGVSYLGVEKGNLAVYLENSVSNGSMDTGGCSQTWQMADGRLRLIALGNTRFSRSNLAYSSWDWDLLKGTWTTTTNGGGENERDLVKKSVKTHDPIYFENFDLARDCPAPSNSSQ